MSTAQAEQTGLTSDISIAGNFALIEYKEIKHGEQAILNMAGREFFGRNLVVNWAKNAQKHAKIGSKQAALQP